MLITLHMFSLSVACTLNTQLKLWCTVLRQPVNGNFNLTPTVLATYTLRTLLIVGTNFSGLVTYSVWQVLILAF